MSTVGQLIAGESYSSSSGIPGSFGFYPAPAPAPASVIGSASFPSGQATEALFSYTPKGGKASSCTACSGNLRSSGGSSSMADVFSPEGESRFCGKCFCTWLLAGIVLLLILFAGDDDNG